MTTPPEETLAALNAAFAIDHDTDGAIQIETGAGGLPRVVVNTSRCRGAVSLYGAQVLEWQPSEQEPVLWLSPSAIYEDGTAIRGGIPICFPWFGAPSIPPIEC